jgi:PIN domain nuclease of toxin-antitoxin system
MIAGVTDTHAALWYLFGDSRLSLAARIFIDQASRSGRKVVLSVISLAEILYLVEKGRLPAAAYDKLREVLRIVDYVIDEVSLTAGIIDAMRQVSRIEVPDMPDRIVAGTAIYFGVPVISRDGRIRASRLHTVW